MKKGGKAYILHNVGNHYDNLPQKLTPKGDFLMKRESYEKNKELKGKDRGDIFMHYGGDKNNFKEEFPMTVWLQCIFQTKLKTTAIAPKRYKPGICFKKGPSWHPSHLPDRMNKGNPL